jgi:TolB-like protein/DNA-binding winged helix-turn-helix (wHTH) protein
VNGDIRIGPWLVQPSLNTISQNGASTRLEPKVMAVLVCLTAHTGEVVPKEELLQTVWPDTFITDDVLKRSISELRRVFGDDARESKIIETIPRRGYRLVVPAERVNGFSSANIASSPASVSDSSQTLRRRLPKLRRRLALGVGTALLLLSLPYVVNLGVFRHWLATDHAPAIRSLAVLPLQSLSEDPKQEYFAEGMTDALITDLAQLGSLKVVSRTTVMRYGRPNKSLPQIARELNVDGIVEGTVQRSGDRVRITAQLIYGPADQHLWANSFERDMKDMLELQSIVASEIVHEIQLKVTPAKQARLRDMPRVNPKAVDAYVEARFHLDQATKLEYYKGKRQQQDNELREAVSYLDIAIQENPNYISAYVAYFDAVDRMAISRLEYLLKARAGLTRALQLDPSNETALSKLSKLYMQYDYDWPAAEREIRRNVEVNPSSAEAHYQYAEYLNDVEGGLDSEGGTSDAKRELELAQALDPASRRPTIHSPWG